VIGLLPEGHAVSDLPWGEVEMVFVGNKVPKVEARHQVEVRQCNTMVTQR